MFYEKYIWDLIAILLFAFIDCVLIVEYLRAEYEHKEYMHSTEGRNKRTRKRTKKIPKKISEKIFEKLSEKIPKKILEKLSFTIGTRIPIIALICLFLAITSYYVPLVFDFPYFITGTCKTANIKVANIYYHSGKGGVEITINTANGDLYSYYGNTKLYANEEVRISYLPHSKRIKELVVNK